MELIKVSNLGKAYKQYPHQWARFAEWFVPFAGVRHSLQWVLKDINFTLSKGESIGIIGENGAGKSTLLKLITGTTQPTTGNICVRGRISALLELGMGFHPDFSGRQNVFMSGRLLGLSHDEINRKFSDIESFARIGKYIDQPVRVYSSGMQVRLAFSVATFVRPELLIVDEALSVGDAAFQRKCFQRINDFLVDGTTLLFVSHDTDTIKRICSKTLFLKNGMVEAIGDSKSVCDLYEKYMLSGNENRVPEQKKNLQATYDPGIKKECVREYGDGRVEIEDINFFDSNNYKINTVETNQTIYFSFKVVSRALISEPVFGMQVKTKEGIALFGTNSKFLNYSLSRIEKNTIIKVNFTLNIQLAPGIYYFNCAVSDQQESYLCRKIDAAILKVTQKEQPTVAIGLIDLQARIKVESEGLKGLNNF